MVTCSHDTRSSKKEDPVLWLINGIVNQYWFGNSQVPLCLAKDRATQKRTIIKEHTNPSSKIQHKKYFSKTEIWDLLEFTGRLAEILEKEAESSKISYKTQA